MELVEEEIEPRGEHPLENSLILETISQYCSFKELKVCRQVSKQWFQSSMKEFRFSAKVNISGDHTMSKFLKTVEETNIPFLEAPFVQNYCLSIYNICEDFWILCGPSIKVLELRGTTFKSVDDFRNVIYNCCPKLEELTLHRVRIAGKRSAVVEPTEWNQPDLGYWRNLKVLKLDDINGDLGLSWMELLSNFLSLEALTLKGPIPNFDGLFRSLNIIRRGDPSKLKLVRLNTEKANFVESPPRELLRTLMDSDLALESLYISASSIPEESNECGLKAVLSNHASSLEELVLGRRGRNLNPYDIFPLRNQKNLDNVTCVVFYASVFKSMTFLKFLPNLKTLILLEAFNYVVRETNPSDMANFQSTTCTRLDVDWWPHQSIPELRKLMDWLPNLENLRMSLDNEMFTLVCEHWPNLVHLRGSGFGLDDYGVTGFDYADVDRINRERGSWRPITVPRPNITALNSLQTFQVDSHFGYCGTKYGLQRLPNLNRPNVSKCRNRNTKYSSPL